MQAHFDLEREKSRELFRQYINDNMDGTCRCNFHSQIELYFVDDGQIDAFVNHHRRVLHKDQMAVALSYDPHLFRSLEPSRSSVLVIPPDLCREFAAEVQNKQVKNPFICDPDTVRLLRSYADYIRTGSGNHVALRGYLYVILGIVLDNLFLEKTESPADTELSNRMLFHFHQHFRGEISLQSLSAEFGYSQSYLSRYFKDAIGIGISQYLNILRLRHALLLLQDGHNTHTYCAMESGFSSMRTFYRVFRQELGCAPGAYTPLLTGDHANHATARMGEPSAFSSFSG